MAPQEQGGNEMPARDVISGLSRFEFWLYSSWFKFLIQYRKTLLGPVWLLVGPALFILVLGLLFSQVNAVDADLFIPHLTIGLITWTLISGFVTNSTTVFQRSRPQILQGTMRLSDIVMVDIISTVLQFLHQVVIVFAVFLIYSRSVSLYSFVSLLGLALLIANGIWLTVFFGIIGARFRDLAEIVGAIMRIAFLATPIIWLPGETSHGLLMSAFLTFNPFYHFLELVRAPLLNAAIAPLSWMVVLTLTVIGFALAIVFYQRFFRQVPLWV